MTTGFWFTTQASQMLEEKDLSTNPFFTLSVYERKQNHGYWEKGISWQAPRTIYAVLKETVWNIISSFLFFLLC